MTPPETTAEPPTVPPEHEACDKAYFGYPRVSPQEFVARRSHRIGAWGYGPMRFPDPAFQAWVQETTRLMVSPEETDRCRREVLPPDEYAALKQALAKNPCPFD